LLWVKFLCSAEFVKSVQTVLYIIVEAILTKEINVATNVGGKKSMVKISEEDYIKLQNHFMKSILRTKMMQQNDQEELKKHEKSSVLGSFLRNLVGQPQMSNDKNALGTLTKDKSIINNFINFDLILGSRKYIATVD
jgi:LAS superfamily LD-carboxypeptidase LdcB